MGWIRLWNENEKERIKKILRMREIKKYYMTLEIETVHLTFLYTHDNKLVLIEAVC